MAKKVSTTRKCKKGKERKGAGNRCVLKCKTTHKRFGTACVKHKKPNYVLNEITNRFVKKDGAVAKWIKGKGPTPRGYDPTMSYIHQLAWI